MGIAYIGMKGLFEYLGIEVITPPTHSKKTLELGVLNSPEFACLPLKINMGNYIEAIEKGADTVVMAGGCGPCRFGYYGEVQREILKDIGYDINFVVLEPPQGDFTRFAKNIKSLTGQASIFRIFKAIQFAWKKIKYCDGLEKKYRFIKPREIKKDESAKIFNYYVNQINKVRTFKELDNAYKEGQKKLDSIEIDPKKPVLKIALVGEIYTLIEPFVNFHVEDILGELKVDVRKHIFLSTWIEDHIFKEAIGIKPGKKYLKAARPYLKNFVGGHGVETVGSTVIYGREMYDGVIQILPLTCMPEIIAQSILPHVSRDYSIPVMTLVVDEMTGEAGFKTRIEAFVDLVTSKKLEGLEVMAN
jgi:predicted nucleotide-binding protein (sugar kinase/HSP70/actin superfamily)